MKKIFTLLALSLLLLSSCNTKNTESPKVLGVMRSINFSYNGTANTPTVTDGNYSFSINLDDMTAAIAGAVVLNSTTTLNLQLANLRAEYDTDAKEYVLTLVAPTKCGQYTIYDLTAHIDARATEMYSSYVQLQVDDDYQVFSYLPALYFENVTSYATTDESGEIVLGNTSYRISIDLTNGLADLTMTNVITLSSATSMRFKGLKLSTTRDGFVITMPDDTESIRQDDRPERLEAVNITFSAPTGTFRITDCRISTIASSLTVTNAQGRI